MTNRALLIIMDGWGETKKQEHNAIYLAKPEFYNEMSVKYSHSLLKACGLSVGLPEGQMGNSEVGHMNIGAGRVVKQELVKITDVADSGGLANIEVLKEAFQKVKANNSCLHLMGLVSDGGVHSHYKHSLRLIDAALGHGIKEICYHALLDGRDTPPRSAGTWLSEVEGYLQKKNLAPIASIHGRYYGMDRDKRWDRVQKAFLALTKGEGLKSHNALIALKEAYERGEDDEFVLPTICEAGFKPIKDGDVIIMWNFRADRMREIARAFTEKNFEGFDVSFRPKLSDYVCFTEYEETFNLPVVFPPEYLTNTLGEVVANAGLAQLRIAETEKYAHVTFFLNGGEEKQFEHEERVLVASPRDVPTYDHKPEMSAFEVTEKLTAEIEKEKFDLIVCNYANSDMVGHTGIESAAIKAVKAVDKCLSKVVPLALSHGYSLFITADHGNSEEMVDENGAPHTAHTLNPVPFFFIPNAALHISKFSLSDGILADLAPTILQIMELPVPKEMTGKNLIKAEK